jgi:hypothetical protein
MVQTEVKFSAETTGATCRDDSTKLSLSTGDPKSTIAFHNCLCRTVDNLIL